MPRICISGSHSTGKSTVIDALKEMPDLMKRFTFKTEILRDIKKTGIKINEFGSDETQMIVMAKHMEYATIPNTILDRGVLDGMVYTAYLYEKNQIKKSTLKIAESIFENIRYDIQFYIAPEFDIVPDGVRSENTEFRDRVAELFEEYMEAYKIIPIRLAGNVDQRVLQFTDTLAGYNKWIKMETKEKTEFMKEMQQGFLDCTEENKLNVRRT
jgi:nicotinamide riboside kinase